MPDDTYRSEETASYNFGDQIPGAEYDPTRVPIKPCPPGEHCFYVKDFEIKCNNQFKWNKQSYILNQLRVQLFIPDEFPSAGCSTLAFLPLPTPNQQMPDGLASQWGQFLRALGFDAPKDVYVPAGFQLPMLKGKRCLCVIERQTDATGTFKTDDQGEIRTGPKMFGFSPFPPGWKPTPALVKPSQPGSTAAGPVPQTNQAPASGIQPPQFGDL